MPFFTNRALKNGFACLVLVAAGCTSAPIATPGSVEGPGGKADSAATRVRIDRLGRPEITNFTIRDPQIKVSYNADDPFDPAPGAEGQPPPSAIHGEYIAAGVIFWDGLDDGHYSLPAGPLGPYQWADETQLTQQVRNGQKLNADGRAFVSLLSHDYLTVDASKPCDVDSASYLDLELGVEDSCGGRTPNDDVIDTYVTLLVGGPANAESGERSWGDGLGADPRQAASNTWPYLAAPFRAE